MKWHFGGIISLSKSFFFLAIFPALDRGHPKFPGKRTIWAPITLKFHPDRFRITEKPISDNHNLCIQLSKLTWKSYQSSTLGDSGPWGCYESGHISFDSHGTQRANVASTTTGCLWLHAMKVPDMSGWIGGVPDIAYPNLESDCRSVSGIVD